MQIEYEDYKSRVEYSSHNNYEIIIPPPVSYATMLCKVMAIGTEGKNAIAEVKCQSVLPMSVCLDMYHALGINYIFKYQLTQFIIHAYFDIEKSINEDEAERAWAIVEFYSEEVKKYL